MILYKYVGIDTAIHILQNRRIRFTQPEWFNDPFESRPLFDSVIERGTIDEICVLEDPEETERWRAQMRGLLADPELRDWYATGQLRNLAILCLTARPDSVLMWAHYAQYHRGCAIGLDSEHPAFNQRADGGTRTLRQVKYLADRPQVETIHPDFFEELFCSKSPEWQYEEEWRLFDAAPFAHHEMTVNGERVLLYNIDPAIIREVVIGSRMTGEPLDRLMAVLGRPEYAHVRRRHATLHPSRYQIELND